MGRLLSLFRRWAAPNENVGAKIGAVRPDYGSTLDANLCENVRILSNFLEHGPTKSCDASRSIIEPSLRVSLSLKPSSGSTPRMVRKATVFHLNREVDLPQPFSVTRAPLVISQFTATHRGQFQRPRPAP
jgi:hypothetical protein